MNVKSKDSTPFSGRARIRRRLFRAARPWRAATSSLRRCGVRSSRAHPRRSARPRAPCWSTRSRIQSRRCRTRWDTRVTGRTRAKRTPFKRLEGQFLAEKCTSKGNDAESQPLEREQGGRVLDEYLTRFLQLGQTSLRLIRVRRVGIFFYDLPI